MTYLLVFMSSAPAQFWAHSLPTRFLGSLWASSVLRGHSPQAQQGDSCLYTEMSQEKYLSGGMISFSFESVERL